MILHRQDNMNIIQLSIKRLFDITAALMGLVILSPLFAVIALYIKVKNKGMVISRDEYIGLDGEPFTLYSFTSIKHFSRLPQLYNILTGSMSFVGPEPQQQSYIDIISERTADYAIIEQMRPGLFSESATYLGKADTIDKMLNRLDLDIRYYRHRTLLLDTSILISSIPTL